MYNEEKKGKKRIFRANCTVFGILPCRRSVDISYVYLFWISPSRRAKRYPCIRTYPYLSMTYSYISIYLYISIVQVPRCVCFPLDHLGAVQARVHPHYNGQGQKHIPGTQCNAWGCLDTPSWSPVIAGLVDVARRSDLWVCSPLLRHVCRGSYREASDG